MKPIVTFLILLICKVGLAQHIKAFYYVEPTSKDLPVFVRGNLDDKIILLYVQGGDAANGIDFGRSDYPRWKKTLEKHVAIAYFDQRGLNKPVKKIDTSNINQIQNLKDILNIAQSLKEKFNATIYLFGHSNGGRHVLETLGRFPEESVFITGGIVFNTPVTTDFSSKRYNYYRPLYLKNLAQEKMADTGNTAYWKKAFEWIENRDSIHTAEDSKRWNAYVDRAFEPAKRSIGLGMVFKTVFARPYNPIKYLNNKDNKFVGDHFWYAQKKLWDENRQTPLWALLPKIQKPILLITGRYDAISVPEEMEDAHQLLTDSKLKIIQNAAHESFLDQPEEFNAIILNYIKPQS